MIKSSKQITPEIIESYIAEMELEVKRRKKLSSSWKKGKPPMIFDGNDLAINTYEEMIRVLKTLIDNKT